MIYKCPLCEGEGKRKFKVDDGISTIRYTYDTCNGCNGRGLVSDKEFDNKEIIWKVDWPHRPTRTV